MARENKYELWYAVQTADGEQEKMIRFTGDDKKKKNLDICKKMGYRVISCKKLYPFSTIKNQHNFDLIHSLCFNRMHDMEIGEIEWNDEEYEYLENLRSKADTYFILELPVAWLPYEDWKEATEIAMMAVNHREQTCIENGRLDLLKYC